MIKETKTNGNANANNERGGNNMKTNEKFNAFQGEIDFSTFYGGRQGDLDGGTWHGGRQGDLDGGTWHGGRQGNLDGGTWHGGRQGDLDGGTWHGGRQGDLDGGTWHGGRLSSLDICNLPYTCNRDFSSVDNCKASALDPEIQKLEEELERAYNKVIGNISDGDSLPPP